MKVWVGSI